MKADHATWETGLVIPEASKPIPEQTLDAMLRIEVLLSSVLAALRHSVKQEDPSFGSPVRTDKEPVDLAEYNETTAPKAKGKRTSNGK
jgi:hypothetical protein